MKQKRVFSLILILLSFILIPAVSSDCVELRYDDGGSEASHFNPKGHQVGVKFSVPVTSGRLVKTRFEIAAPGDFYVHVYDLDGNDQISPILVTSIVGGWVDVPLNIMVSGDFFIALEFGDSSPWISVDQGAQVSLRSFYRDNSTVPWIPNYDDDLMIRAVVCYKPPVGGQLLLNTSPTIASWLIGVSIIALLYVIVLKRKRLN